MQDGLVWAAQLPTHDGVLGRTRLGGAGGLTQYCRGRQLPYCLTHVRMPGAATPRARAIMPPEAHPCMR